MFLLDLIYPLKEEALKAKKDAEEKKQKGEECGFESGRLMTWFEVIDLLRQQTIAFDIPFEQLNLHDIDPYKDLL
jgi:hypothetical protein